jgi:cytochrome P450
MSSCQIVTEVSGERIDRSQNPMPTYEGLRGRGPVIPAQGVIPIPADWVATDLETVEFVFRHPEDFSSAPGKTSLGNTRPLLPLEVDPPEHIRYRKLLDPFFAPGKLRPLEPALRAQINEFIDSFIARGEADLWSEMFVSYPTQVFLTLYGLPLEDKKLFLRWKDDMIRTSLTDPEAGRRAGEEFYAYMAQLVDARDDGGDDLLSQLLAESRAGTGLTVEEITDVTYLFILAGLDTITNALMLSFAYLATHPEQRHKLVEDPTLVASAVEELLRVETPAPALVRTATRDVDLGGVTVREGETVFCHLGAANGDPAGRPDPDSVDLARRENRHLSFGGGIHRCVGSHLARLEVRLVMEEFHHRIPDYALAPGTNLVGVPLLDPLEGLRITFPPGGGRATAA